MAFFLAVALRRAEGRPPLVGLLPATGAAATACAIAVLIGAMFLVPYTNQSYRQVVFEAFSPPADGRPHDLSKGLTELSWGELNELVRHPPSRRQEALARAHRQIRFAVVASPFGLALLALGLTRRWHSRTATAAAALVALGAYGTCFMLAGEIDGGGYPSAYGVWAANLAFALLGLRLLRSRTDWGEVTA
jgi:lipopolysaccharide export LptBFGC system permease protein LptF